MDFEQFVLAHEPAIRLSFFLGVFAAVALWDQVAAAGSAWAEEARIKAEAVRMQKRLRGQPLPPAQEPGTAVASASTGGPATAAARTDAP